MKQLLMIFVKNAKAGTVKTRLAHSKGHEFALEIYIKLLDHTLQVAQSTGVPVAIFYSEYIEEKDAQRFPSALQYVQKGDDLGQRMANAFQQAFKLGYSKVVIIGSDCPGITESHIHKAMQLLQNNDLVIGPATDGGYYLLGMRNYYPQLFENKCWSSPFLLEQTETTAQTLNLSYSKLATLSDVDDEKDLDHYYKYIK